MALAAVVVVLATLSVGCLECGRKAATDDPLSAESRAEAQVDPAVARPVGSAPATTAMAGRPAVDTDPRATVRLGLQAEPAHLNPLLGADAMVNAVALGDIYQGLLCRDGFDRLPYGCLAERYEVSADERVFTFHLRPGVRWHDGRSLTVQDVAYTLSLVIGDGAISSSLVAEFDDLVKVEQRGDTVVRVEFAERRGGRLEAFVRLVILPAHYFEGVRGGKMITTPASSKPVGTGPLKFAAWERGVSIRLERFDGYWGQPALAAVVEHVIVGDREQSKRAFSAGELDLLVSLPANDVRSLVAKAGGKVVSIAEPAYVAAVFNCKSTQLASVDHRRALAHLLDRETVIREVFGGVGEPMSGPFLAADGAYDARVVAPGFDPAAATRLLAETRPAVSILVPAESKSMARLADIWAADAKRAADLTVENVPYATVLDRMRDGRFEIALMGLTTGLDVDVYGQFHSSGIGGENLSGVSDRELDSLLEAFRIAPASARAEFGRPVHARLAALAPYVFVASDVRLGAARADLVGVEYGRGAARFIGREVSAAP